MTKQCTKCKIWKSFENFVFNSQYKDNFHCWCKKCKNLYWRKHWHKYRQTKREKQLHNESNKRYRKTVNGHLHHCFYGIKHRCSNPRCKAYKNYGGRGIKCKFKSAKDFVNYVINELRIDPRGLQIDRIDNDGHYERGNIRFTTAKINSNNRRKCKCKE